MKSCIFLLCIYRITSSETPIRFPLLILPASVLITTIEVNGSCLDVDKCIDVAVEAPPPAELLFVVVKSRIEDELGKLLTVLCVEDIDFTLLIRPEKLIYNELVMRVENNLSIPLDNIL